MNNTYVAKCPDCDWARRYTSDDAFDDRPRRSARQAAKGHRSHTGHSIDVDAHVGPESACLCESPTVERTTGKGTPDEREYCQCGGLIYE